MQLKFTTKYKANAFNLSDADCIKIVNYYSNRLWTAKFISECGSLLATALVKRGVKAKASKLSHSIPCLRRDKNLSVHIGNNKNNYRNLGCGLSCNKFQLHRLKFFDRINMIIQILKHYPVSSSKSYLNI